MLFLSDIFDKTIKVLNTLETSRSLFPSVQRINYLLNQAIVSSDYFACDLYIDTEWADTNTAFREALFDYFNPSEGIATCDYLQFFITGADVSIDTQPPAAPSVAFIVANQSLRQRETIQSRLKFNSANYQFYIFINIDMDEPGLRKLKFNFAGKAVTIASANLTKTALIPYFETSLVSREGMKDLQTLALLRRVRPLLQELYRNLLQEKRSVDQLSAEKDRLRQEIIRLNNDHGSFERLNKTKTEIQKTLRDLDRAIKKKYADLLLPNGYIVEFVNLMSGKLDAMDTQDSLDNRFPKVITAVDAGYIRTFENSSQHYLHQEFSKDLREIQTKLISLFSIPSPVDNGQKVPLGQHIANTLPFPDKDKLIASYGKLPRNYQGELPRNNFQSYLMHIRQQTFIIFIIVALLNPLFSIPTIFFNNSDYHQADSIRNYINLFVGLVSIGFTIYLIADLKKRTPLIKKEQMTKELDRMKREIRMDGARIFSDAIRDWVTQLTNWFMEFTENLNLQLENRSAGTSNQRKTDIDALENRSAEIQQEINEKTKLHAETDRTIVSLIQEYSGNITNFENRVANLLLRFRNAVERVAKY